MEEQSEQVQAQGVSSNIVDDIRSLASKLDGVREQLNSMASQIEENFNFGADMTKDEETGSGYMACSEDGLDSPREDFTKGRFGERKRKRHNEKLSPFQFFLVLKSFNPDRLQSLADYTDGLVQEWNSKTDEERTLYRNQVTAFYAKKRREIEKQ